MPTLRELIPGFDPSMGALIPGSVPAPQRTLRSPETVGLEDQIAAADMGQLRRGFASGRITGEANAMNADMSSLRAAGRSAEADELSRSIAATQQRAGVFAPAEQDVTKLDWQPGRIVDYALGAVGQGAASMLEPAAAATGLGAASRLMGAIPTGPTRLAGGALRLAAPLAAGYLNYRQNKGEFVSDAYNDPAILAGKTPQEIENAAMFHGAAAGALDTALPGMVGERMAGRTGMKALSGMGVLPKTALDMVGEAGTETLQGEVKRGTLGFLNPNRDTSGDTADRWNDAVGGALGAGPFSLASNLAQKGHARLDVKDDGEVGDSLEKGATGRPAPLPQPSDASVGASVGRKARERATSPQDAAGAEAWRETLMGNNADFDAPGGLEQATRAQHAALVKELGGRAGEGDVVAQQHLAALNAENLDDPVALFESGARDAAREHLIGDGMDHEGLMKAYEGRKLNQMVPHDDLGGGKVTGRSDDVHSTPDPVSKATEQARAEFRQRVKLVGETLAANVPAKLKGVAKSLGEDLMEFGAKSRAKGIDQQSMRVAERMAQQFIKMYGGREAEGELEKAAFHAQVEGTPLYKEVRSRVILAANPTERVKAEQVSREAAATELAKVVPPIIARRMAKRDGADLSDPGVRLDFLDTIEKIFNGQGQFNEGALTREFGEKTVAAMRDLVVVQNLERKAESEIEAPNETGGESGKTAAAVESDRVGEVALGEEASAARDAEKSLDRAPGARQYFFKGRDTPADGASSRNPFVRDGKRGLPVITKSDAVDFDGTRTLDKIEAKAYELLGYNPTETETKVRKGGRTLAPGVRQGITQRKTIDATKDGRHKVGVTSAKDVMDFADMAKSKRAEIFGDYMDNDGLNRGRVTEIQKLDEQIAALTASTPRIKITGGALTGNPEYKKLEALKTKRLALATTLAADADIKRTVANGRDTYSPTLSTTADDLADAYFGDRHLVVADEFMGKDNLRIVLGEFREMTSKGQKLLDLAAKAAKDGTATRTAAEAGMNLIRFKTEFTKSTRDVAVPAGSIVTWVLKNKIEFDKKDGDDAEVRAKNFRNALTSGIAAMLQDGFMEGTPYMLDADGRVESFKAGFPPSLHLGPLTQAELNDRAKNAVTVAKAKEADNKRRRAKLTQEQRDQEDAFEAERRDELVAHDQNRKDEEPVRNTDADELVNDGREAPRTRIDISGSEDSGQATLPGVAPEEIVTGERYWDAPKAETADELAQRTMSNTGEGKRARVPKFPTAPETVDTRSDANRVPSELEADEQTDGVPTERTDIAQRTATANAALDKIVTLTVADAMGKGTTLAKGLWGQFVFDRQAAFKRVQALVRTMATAPQYAVPLALILTPDRVAGLVYTAKPEMQERVRAVLAAMQSKTAGALLKAGQSPAALTTLARGLTGNEKLTPSQAKAALTTLAQPVPMTAKPEPAAAPAPTPAAEARKLNQQATAQASTMSTDAQVEEARAYVEKVLGPKIVAAFAKTLDINGKQHFGEFIEAKNLIELSMAAGPMMLSVAHHESMHALWSRIVRTNEDAALAMQRMTDSPRIVARLNDLLAAYPDALAAIQGDSAIAQEERIAYAYQFWAAGELVVDKKPATWFDKVRRGLRVVFGMVRDSESALDIMTAFHDGKLAEPSAAGKVISAIMAKQTWNEDVRRKFDKQIQALHAAVDVSNEVMRKSESKTMRELASVFFSNPGRESAGQHAEGYLNARGRVVRQYTNYLFAGVKNLNEVQMAEVAKLMQTKAALKDIASPVLRKAVSDMRALTKRYYNYATKSVAEGGPGLKLEYLGEDHYPRVWDLAQLIKRKDEFVAMLMQPKYDKIMASALSIANKTAKTPLTKADVATKMLEHLVEKNGVDDKGVETNHDDLILSPFFASQKERSFKWLEDAEVEPFLEKDLVGAMSRYLHQGIRAAEFARRFGNNGERLRELTQVIGDSNPDGSAVATDGPVVKELRAAAKEKGIAPGKATDEWVARRMEDLKNSVAAHEGSLGHDISPAWRKTSSALMAYQNLRLLPLSLFAAFADPMSISARSDRGMAPAFDAMTQGLKDVWARWKAAASDYPAERQRSVWEKMAEASGAVDSHMFLEQIGKAHTSEFMTDFARKSNRMLFMANGLTAWDRSMRVTATKYAALFIADHKDLPNKQHSARWLAELGLKPADITLDKDGVLIFDRRVLAATRYTEGMTDEQKAAVLTQATAEIERVHTAVVRFVEGSVLTPNAAQRPTWASDPRYGVLFHLKQFTYSFQDTVLKRAANEAGHGNMGPVQSLLAAVPVMMVSDVLKGFVQGGGTLPAYMKAWGFGDSLMHGVSRAGLGGVSQLGVDALRDPVSLLGPTVGQITKFVLNPGDLGANLKDAVPGLRMLGGLPDLTRVVD